MKGSRGPAQIHIRGLCHWAGEHILEAVGESARSQKCKQRAATKRGVNMVMERVVRGTIGAVAVGTGDAAEMLTSPSEVARECSEWSDRRMSLMQPK